MTKSRVLVRAEGGLGDCLLSNRFIPAIREKHADSHITFGFDNSRGETYQLSVLKEYFPTMSDRYCLFGEVNKNDFDFFYDLHIDKMEWTKYDIDWLSRFYYFPKPEKRIEKKDHVCLHLTHNLWEPKNLKKEYITNLVNKLLESGNKLVAICTEREQERYSDVSNKIQIVCSTISNACKAVLSAQAFITIDSGFKYLAYSNGVPTIETSNYHLNLGKVPELIRARWIPFQERGVPLYASVEILDLALKNILENRISAIQPFHKSNQATFKL